MKLLKQAMAVLGTVVVIAVIAALVTPKTAHALVATMVQVVNTSTSPVPTKRVDNPAQQPFQFFVTGGNPFFEFQVPPGKTLVMEQIGMNCFEPAANLFATDYRVSTTAGGVFGQFLFPSTTFGNDVLMNQMTRIYADGGSIVTLGTGSGAPAGS